MRDGSVPVENRWSGNENDVEMSIAVSLFPFRDEARKLSDNRRDQRLKVTALLSNETLKRPELGQI